MINPCSQGLNGRFLTSHYHLSGVKNDRVRIRVDQRVLYLPLIPA